MKTSSALLIVAVLACSVACRRNNAAEGAGTPGKADVLARYHFAGSAFLANNTNGAKLREILTLPETQAFREQTLTKLARAPRTLFGDKVSSEQDERAAALLKPLLDNLLLNESYFELHGSESQTPEWMLAVHLSPESSKLWRDNVAELVQVLKLGTLSSNVVDGFPAWQLRRTAGPNLFRVADAGPWLVLGLGQDKLPHSDEALRLIRSTRRPGGIDTNAWFSLEANLPRLARWLPLPSNFPWPHANANVLGQGENLRTRVHLTFPEAVTGPLDPWQVPTNLINEPLISFTAMRGISPLLKHCALLGKLDVDPPPNELYFWAQSHVSFQSFVGFPLKEAESKLEQAGDRAASLFSTNWQSRGLAKIAWQTNAHQLQWKGLPYIVPFLAPAKYNGTEFVAGGLFPSAPLTNPPPAEMLSQLTGQSKLVYYDWEITQARLSSWRIMAQLFAVIANKPQFTTNHAALPWMIAIEPKLGNAITEISVDSPKEWFLSRKSPIGFTGIELVALARWMESTNFPKFSFDLPEGQSKRPASKQFPMPVTSPPAPVKGPPQK